MEAIAKSNNIAVELLQSGNYRQAGFELERALRCLLVKTKQYEQCDNAGVCGNNPHRGQERSIHQNGIVIISRMMLFDTFHSQCHLRFSTSSSNHVARRGCSPSMMNTPHLFASGVKFDCDLVRQVEHEACILLSGISTILLASMSAAILFNLALLNQLRAESLLVLRNREQQKRSCDESPFKFLECAHRLYMKVEQTLYSMTLNPLFQEDGVHNDSDASLQPMVEFLYMATWNNEGQLALGKANYENSRRCFNNLYDFSRIVLARAPRGASLFETQLHCPEVEEFPSGGGLNNSFTSDTNATATAHGGKETTVYSSLAFYAFYFMVNATCFRNAGNHAVAA